jgi:DNA topoisomerase-1
LPREVGRHPEDGEPIVAGIGRFGAYVQHGKTYANLEPGDDVLNIGLNRAVTLIAEKLIKGPRKRFGDPGRMLGEHPEKGGPVVAKQGRYGPYVSHDGINATLPRDKTPDAITLDEALALIAARAERVGEARPSRGRTARPAAERAAAEAAPKDVAARNSAAAKPRAATSDKKPAAAGKSAAPRKPAKSPAAKTASAPRPARTAAKRAKGSK